METRTAQSGGPHGTRKGLRVGCWSWPCLSLGLGACRAWGLARWRVFGLLLASFSALFVQVTSFPLIHTNTQGIRNRT